MRLNNNAGLASGWDVIVIGGGPAGMMAAGRAGELGKRVLLLEKKDNLGEKLLLTGGGRCNLTRAEFDNNEFVKNLGGDRDFFYSSFSKFGVKETIDFFENRSLQLKTERGKRIFPKSDKAQDVLKCLERYLKKGKVNIRKGERITALKQKQGKICGVKTTEKLWQAKNYILATGGKSYPRTGSTGDGLRWAEKLGHTVTNLSPALSPLKIKEKWVSELQGLDLKNVKLSVYLDNQKKAEKFGDMLFTHFGASGPIALALSKQVGALLKKGEVKLHIDLKPGLSFSALDKRLSRDFKASNRKFFKNSLNAILPSKIIPIIVELSGICPHKLVSQIKKQEKKKLIHLLKEISLTVEQVLGFKYALVTSGGVSAKEIEQKTMRSKIIPNLFFAGEIINLDGPSGGYNLQIAWTTGYVAGENAAKI